MTAEPSGKGRGYDSLNPPYLNLGRARNYGAIVGKIVGETVAAVAQPECRRRPAPSRQQVDEAEAISCLHRKFALRGARVEIRPVRGIGYLLSTTE